MKNRVIISIVLFISFVLFPGCDLLDPPPSDTDIQAAMADCQSGQMSISAAGHTNTTVDGYDIQTNAAGTASISALSGATGLPYAQTVTFMNYRGTTYRVSGRSTTTITGIDVATMMPNGTMQGKLAFTGGKIRNMLIDVTITSGVSAGTYTVNNWYVYDAVTGKKK